LRFPFTSDFVGAFLVAQTCAALALTALLLFARIGRASKCALFAATWLAALVVLAGPTMDAFLLKHGPHLFRNVLACSAGLATVSALLARRPFVALTALVGQGALWWLVGYLADSDAEVAALHLAWVGLVVGLLMRDQTSKISEDSRPAEEKSYVLDDVVLFASATGLAALVCIFVLDGRQGSADEWAYTYQAAVFAKGHAYATSTRCENYLQNFWVFEESGRLFSQYPPGWPLAMTPLVWVHAVWMAGPLSTGLMAWGVARLARSAVRAYGRWDIPPSPRAIRLAGLWAGALSVVGTTTILNGASRFPHVWVAALYAWSLEALLQMSIVGLQRKWQVTWGTVLGAACALMLASRPADGAFLGLGIMTLFVYELVRGRLGWRAVVATAASFGVLGGFVLVILRLQLGKWFVTGYSLQALIHPWAVAKYSWPKGSEWRWGIPFDTGSYCWWPCSVPVGLAGLAMLRGRAQRLTLAFAIGILPYLVFLSCLDYLRAPDFEYGPRYYVALVVPMAVAAGTAFAPLTLSALERVTAGRSALARGAPVALVLFAVVSGWMRIVPVMWPSALEHVRRHSGVDRAIEDQHLTNAVVLILDTTTGFDERDLTTNYPIDLYPDQQVIKAIDRGQPDEAEACLRSVFPGRRFKIASGVYEVKLSP
jgi:hypothetical protein